MRDWLCFPGSMTQRMRAISTNIQIIVLQNQLGLLSREEQNSLKIPHRKSVLIREIEMFCNNELWITARTAMPLESLQGKWRKLKNLGNKPLGDMLFKDAKIQRSPFQFQLLCDDKGFDVWARRSLFYLDQRPILLTEVFSSSMWKSIKK